CHAATTAATLQMRQFGLRPSQSPPTVSVRSVDPQRIISRSRNGALMVLSLQTVRHVDEIVARTQVAGRAPSVIAAVVRGGQVAYVSAAGETPVPGRDTQYRIGSITKTMTAAVVLGLRDEGRLSLDDRLTEHLPETGLDRVRLRQLLCHGAGMQREPD